MRAHVDPEIDLEARGLAVLFHILITADEAKRRALDDAELEAAECRRDTAIARFDPEVRARRLPLLWLLGKSRRDGLKTHRAELKRFESYAEKVASIRAGLVALAGELAPRLRALDLAVKNHDKVMRGRGGWEAVGDSTALFFWNDQDAMLKIAADANSLSGDLTKVARRPCPDAWEMLDSMLRGAGARSPEVQASALGGGAKRSQEIRQKRHRTKPRKRRRSVTVATKRGAAT